jgi:beta-galactosidase
MKEILHGADYNPEQWLRYPGIIDEDFRLLKLAQMNSITIGVFAWASLEPEEGSYNFDWMDEYIRSSTEERNSSYSGDAQRRKT